LNYRWGSDFRLFFGNILARNPSRKIPTRTLMSVIITAVLLMRIPVLSTGKTSVAEIRDQVSEISKAAFDPCRR
jgi:DNA topoisomerase VI subunit B